MAKDKKVEIEWLKISQSLNEGVSSGMEFAWCNKALQQCCVFVHCKDYLQDAVQGHFTKEARSCYGFTYKPEEHPKMSMDRTRMLISNPKDPDLRKKIPNILDFINGIEKKLGLIKSTAREVSNPVNKHKRPGCFLIRSSARWMAASPMVSLYALLLRVGPNHVIGTKFDKALENFKEGKWTPPRAGDSNYLKSAEAGINRILEHGHRKPFYKETKRNYPADIPVYSMHGFGIVGFSSGLKGSGYCKEQVPYFYRNIKKANKKSA